MYLEDTNNLKIRFSENRTVKAPPTFVANYSTRSCYEMLKLEIQNLFKERRIIQLPQHRHLG